MSSGERTATFRRGDADALLRSYLIFVRDMRGQRREPSIELRSDDVGVLARHLGVTEEIVLGGLLDLMGATRAQRSAMLAMLAAGALSVVLSGAVVTGLSDDGVSVEFGRLADAVHAAVSGSDAGSMDSSGGDAAGDGVARAAAPRPVDTAPASGIAERSAVVDARTGSASQPSDDSISDLSLATPTPDVLRSAAAAASTAPVTAADEPTSIAVAPDGSLVASVAPPVPAAAPAEPVAVGQLPDGTTVGVAAPPVPPPVDEPVATAELPDGTTVGVVAPPVPPAPED